MRGADDADGGGDVSADLGVGLDRLAALIDAGTDVGAWPAPVALAAAVDRLEAASVDAPTDHALLYLRVAASALLAATRATAAGADHREAFELFGRFVQLVRAELNGECAASST